MPSLFEKMFDTMPLTGVMDAVSTYITGPGDATVGQLKRHMDVYLKPPTIDTKDHGPSPAGTAADDARIWGWHTAGDPSQVTRVTCRVRDMDFAEYLVLELVEFGFAPLDDPKHFRRTVKAVLKGKGPNRDRMLDLTAEYHLVSFTTKDGYIPANKNPALWPLESHHDESLVHFFAYDIDIDSNAIFPLTNPQHPDKKKVDEMLARMDELGKASEDDSRNAKFLFKDDLWDTSPCNAPPTGTAHEVCEDVPLKLNAIRILVACSLTTCRERDDFQPGKLGGVARLYPHVMVIATAPLERVEAGVHLRRPEMTTPSEPHAHHHMSGADEMLPPLKSLLIADSNARGMVLHNMPKDKTGTLVPVPYWANLFNYYVVDPIKKDSGVGDKLIPIVRHSMTSPRNVPGYVNRDCSDLFDPLTSMSANQIRVLKRERQGYFDNIHIAPRMRVKDAIATVQIIQHDYVKTAEAAADVPAWRMDEVVMAPFCAHDCFHMHWRWSDNANVENATRGWGPVEPSAEFGRVMVPENQDVFLQLLSDSEISYIAQAHNPPKDVWQPFCHHGAGYAVHIGDPMEQARSVATGADDMWFYDSKGNRLSPTSWALFYWRLRYRLVPAGKRSWLGAGGHSLSVAVEERFAFVDKDGKNGEREALDL